MPTHGRKGRLPAGTGAAASQSNGSHTGRREFLKRGAGGLLATAAVAVGAASPAASATARQGAAGGLASDLEEATVAELQAAMAAGRLTARSLARHYLRRIERLDREGPRLGSVIEVNPDALAFAEDLDRERRTQGARGPWHGVPVLVKDNLDTADRMATTAGSLALAGTSAPRDAFVVERLRRAGAVILGKTNLSEWANFRSSRSTSGWSGRGGQTRNPYVLDRNPSGSSSGSAVAVSANLCAAAVGTETDGSILSPSSYCGIVGLKPTVGLVSRSGIIPISASQDTAGPMTRTVADAALLLGILAGPDPRDPATAVEGARFESDYARFLDPEGLRGARLGVVRKPGGFPAVMQPKIEAALEALRRAGAELVEGIEFDGLREMSSAEQEILQFEFKAGLNAYLAGRESSVRFRTLAELIDFNERERSREMPWFGQEVFLASQAKGPLTDPAYLAARETARRRSRTEGIDAVMDRHRLEALVAPTSGPAHVTDHLLGDRGAGWVHLPSAVAGYPSLTVPAGQLYGLPFGLTFAGRAWSEPVLLRLGFAFEQATRARRRPGFRSDLAPEPT